ncbi:pentapeptide repeat-containing protein [Campylobacter jejuni]|nr:pentapeptide repeat-containing protein [Campylobacter jejuni]EBI2424150.1 pentapeptide repeat-containing protein [Campylobacter jejuni]EGS6711751.1 pentapeptide repeat-containing protein [Campylobacter jejuni]EJK3647338.1 pentapeptide repeat-containing protein [Campylobacter jejuni]HEB8456229.1 pentapeptide repeat-containing protein [Campylobacter jejuni]
MEEKIKQAIENIAKNLEVHKEYIRFDNTEQIYIIEDYLNNKIIEIKKNIKFDNLIDYPLKFYYCDFLETVIGRNKTFKEKIIFEEVVFCKVVNFSFSIFDKNINFSNVKFEDKLYFDKCQFKEKFEFFGINNLKAEFNSSHFKKEVYFGKEITDKNVEKSNSFGSCSFEYANFSNCHFKKEVYFKNNDFKQVFFRNSKFNNNIHFNNSIFKDYADFHECEFEKTACFYGVKFDKTPNFSQAIFKGNLNAVNTNLNFTFDDLQERIKQEYAFYETQRTAKEAGVIPNLYQEKSLDKFANDFRDSFRIFKNALIKDNNLLDASNFHKYELYCKEIELKNKKGKTFKDVVDRWQLLFYRKLCDHHTDILQSLNSLILVIGIFVISSVAMVVGFNYSLGYKPILEHWYFSLDFYNHHINSIIQDNYLFVATVNLVMLFGYLILVGFALCLKYMREFFIIISYVITLLVLAISPKILIPAMGIFTDKRAMLDPLSVFGGIYTIIFGFVAFSFIKTIRKNSIVPS